MEIASASLRSSQLTELQSSKAFIHANWDVSQLKLPSYRFSHVARYHPYPRGGPRRHFDPFWDDFEAQFDLPQPAQGAIPDFFAQSPRYRPTSGDENTGETRDYKGGVGYTLVVIDDFSLISNASMRRGRKF